MCTVLVVRPTCPLAVKTGIVLELAGALIVDIHLYREAAHKGHS